MTVAEVRKKYLEFFEKRGHAVIPSASLVPENDPTTLFTGSGMQPLVPYLLGTPHPLGKRVTNSQKSFRAEDIDEVGDNRHTTFFEMLGNWSFGDYWEEDQLGWFFEFLTDEIKLKPGNLYVTVFCGDEGIGQDNLAIETWQKLFKKKDIDAKYIRLETLEQASDRGMKDDEHIFGYGVKKNWWSRAGIPSKMPAGEPGGTDSEVFYDFGATNERGVPRHDEKFGKYCHPNCDCGRFLEIGNSVFMEYKKKEDGTFEKLAQRNVDFGGGLERITAASNNDSDVFNIDVFDKAKQEIAALCGVRYEENRDEIVSVGQNTNVHGIPIKDVRRAYRVILDHIRSATFLIADGVLPSKAERGYLVRRLLRRTVRFANNLNLPEGNLSRLAESFVDTYPELNEKRQVISSAIAHEEGDFRSVLAREGKRLEQYVHEAVLNPDHKLDTSIVFQFVTTHGVPLDYIKDEAKRAGVIIDEKEFEKEFEKHRELSRTASAGTFKGGLADHSEKTTQLHTTHHLLLKALQVVLGSHVKQRGSNITSERLRIDFSHDAKMTDEQKKEVEKIVNEKIAEDLPVIRSEIAREDAEKLGAEHEFGQKYPDRVSVYSVGPKSTTQENPQFDESFSIEFCGGPHVTHTAEIKGKFRIAKEEASSAGIRRIKGIVE